MRQQVYVVWLQHKAGAHQLSLESECLWPQPEFITLMVPGGASTIGLPRRRS